MTSIGSAAAMNRSWNNVEGSLADAGHKLRGYKCGVWAPGFEQFEDQELPTEVRDRSHANMQDCTHVGLGQPAEPSTQTTERVEKALAMLQSWRKENGGRRMENGGWTMEEGDVML